MWPNTIWLGARLKIIGSGLKPCLCAYDTFYQQLTWAGGTNVAWFLEDFIWAATSENRSSGFSDQVPHKTGLYSHRRRLETWNFGFRKQRDCTIQLAKTKALISFAVTAKLICVFVFRICKNPVFSRRGSF